MEEKLDFSLPQRKKKWPAVPGLVVLLLMVAVVLTLAGLILQLQAMPK